MVKSVRTKYRIAIRQYDQGRRRMFPPAAGIIRSFVNEYKNGPFWFQMKTRRVKAYVAARVLVTSHKRDVWRRW
jgi:hypothetical protein